MIKGSKVRWKDLVSGRTRYGIFIEKQKIVAESQTLKDEYDFPEFKDTERWDCLIKEDRTGKMFSLEENQVEVEKQN